MFEDVRPSDAASLMDNLTRDGYNMVVGCSFVFHEQMFEAAKRHPSVDFLHISGYLGGVPNFATAHGRVYQSAYVSGVTAGAESSVRRIGYVASVPIPEVYSAANAFYLGAQVGAGATVSATHVEHKVDLVVLWIGTFFDPVKEWEAARRLHVMGCDVVAYQTDTQEGSLYAKAAGIYSVGSNSDARRYIGESVLTSSDFNWSPIYTEMINRSYSGTFTTGSHSLWYGYSAGVCVNHDISFEVQDSTKLSFDNEVSRLRQGFDPFCLPARRNGTMLQSVGGCLSDPQLHGMTYIIDGPHELPLMQLHGETCGNGSHFEVRVTHDPPQYLVVCHTCAAGTHAQVHSALEGVTACTLCSAGHYSTAGATQCSPCPEGRFSATGASVCLPCPDSTSNVGVGNTDCPLSTSQDYTVVFIVAGVVGGLLLCGGAVGGWRVVRDRRRIKALHNEKAAIELAICLAEEVASCLSGFDLVSAEDLLQEQDRDGILPPGLTNALRGLLHNLGMYKPYLPKSCLLQDSSEDAKLERAQASSAHSPSIKSAGPLHAMGKSMWEAQSFIGDRKLTLTVVNLHGTAAGLDRAEVELHSGVFAYTLAKVMRAVEAARGIVDIFVGDRIFSSFNASKLCLQHPVCAVEAMTTVMLGESGLNSAVVAGRAHCGDMGCTEIRRFSVTGKLPMVLRALERAGRVMGIATICNSTVHSAASLELPLRLLPRMVELARHTLDGESAPRQLTLDRPPGIKVPDASEDCCMFVFEALVRQPEFRTVVQEWMYQVESLGSWDAYNRTVRMFLRGEDGVDEDLGDAYFEKVQAALRRGNRIPLRIVI